MDITNYISSGILEQYVLGDLNAQQQLEVEAMSSQYPEIKAEIESIEDALEFIAQSAAVSPPPGLGVKIFDSIDDKNPPSSNNAPQNPPPPNNGGSSGIEGQSKSNPFKGLTFLAGFLLLGSLVWGFMQSSNSTKHEQALTEMTQQYNQLDSDCKKLQINNTHIAFLKDTNTSSILMKGTDNSPKSAATVFWNKEEQKAFLDTGSMPSVPTGKQYQLWAIVDGAPVDMGVFDPITDDTIFIEVPFIETPQAFAVTLEDEGGSPTPTMEQMYVLGEV